MPNFDGGHYFLTALIPLQSQPVPQEGGVPQSPEQLTRNALICLPTAQQSLGGVALKGTKHLDSPFSVSDRAHLARFVVIDDAVYNGRDPQNAIITAVTGTNPVIPRKVDKLNAHYLFFSADIDADSGDVSELRSFLTELWEGSEAMFRSVFEYCLKFDKVKTADDFCDYIISCQIETTMPFNDYWRTPPPLKNMPLTWPGIGLIATFAGSVVSLFLWLLNAVGIPTYDLVKGLTPHGWSWWGVAAIGLGLTIFSSSRLKGPNLTKLFTLRYLFVFLSVMLFFAGLVHALALSLFRIEEVNWGILGIVLLVLTAIIAYGLYCWIMSVGSQPYPTAPDSKLSGVLKALYLQQEFTEFAIEHQGQSGADLHQAFADFIERTKPADVTGPTKKPGHL